MNTNRLSQIIPLLFLSFTATFLLRKFHINLLWAIVLAIIVIFFYIFRHLFILNFSNNMKRVENVLRWKKKQDPYYDFLFNMSNGNFVQAKRNMHQLRHRRYEQIKAKGKVRLLIEQFQLNEAKEETKNIKNEDHKNFTLAAIALLEDDWFTFYRLKKQTKNITFHYILETENAFKKGNMQEAQAWLQQVLSKVSGYKKYALLQSVQRKEQGLNRKSYF